MSTIDFIVISSCVLVYYGSWIMLFYESKKNRERKIKAECQPRQDDMNDQIIHHLKIKSEYFKLVYSGVKKFEIRKNDRDFKVGDLVHLHEMNGSEHTGHTYIFEIKYIFQGGEYGLDPEYVIFNW